MYLPPWLHIGQIYVPWQQISHFIGWPLRQHTQDIVKVSFRIDTIEPARSDKTIQQRSTFTTMIAAEEDVVFLAKTDRSQCALSRVIIRLCKALIAVVAQRIPPVQSISERLAQPGFFRQSLLNHRSCCITFRLSD